MKNKDELNEYLWKKARRHNIAKYATGILLGLATIFFATQVFQYSMGFNNSIHNIDNALNYANQECDECLVHGRDYGIDKYGTPRYFNLLNLYVESSKDIFIQYRKGILFGALFGITLTMLIYEGAR